MLENIANYYAQILILISVTTVAIISPGPDFAIVVKNSLVHSRRAGLYTAFGIAVAALIHASYTMLGLGVLIAETRWLFAGMQYCGALYLLYIGSKGLMAKKNTLVHDAGIVHGKDILAFKAFKTGFITCALNPKAILFFIGMFAVVVTEDLPVALMVLFVSIIFIETLVWFSFVAFCLSAKRTREKFRKIGHIIERITGIVLILLALKLLFTVF